jgi:hypothetical protein
MGVDEIEGETMTQFLILFIFAILVEALISMTVGDLTTPKWVKKVASIVLGVGVCIVYKVGLIALLGVEGGIPMVDFILTGVIISRGSNFLNDILTRIKGGNVTTTTTVTPIVPDSSTTTTTETTPTEPPVQG